MSRSSTEILSQEFLLTRAKILEVAAFYDRLGQLPDNAAEQRQLDLLNSACAILNDNPGWRDEFGI